MERDTNSRPNRHVDATSNASTGNPDTAATGEQQTSDDTARGMDEFLMPGPTPTSNQGTARWAVSWLAFSIALMLFMLLISVICFGIARLGGLA